MSSAPLDTTIKERIKRAIDIVDLVGDQISLRRQGRNYVGLCPWHDDSRPSLQVNPERQSYKCWVCDKGGDVFSFQMEIDSCTFPEALRILADRAGIALPRRDSTQGPSSADEADARLLLLQAHAWAEQQYHDCLTHAPEGEIARRYLDQRNVTRESWVQFRLGFAPDQWGWLTNRAQGTRFTPQVLETAGLLARSERRGSLYDRFKGRVLFSIRDAQSRPVAFGGRILAETATERSAKYVNSPETPLFSKSNLLYAVDLARDAIRKSGTAIVVEGYTDCIAAHQHGFENTIAVLGTALGEGHVRLLRRYADRIILVLDGDEAGQRRANEILELFVAEPVDLRILTLPESLDPCDYLISRGAEAFAGLLEQSIDALEHKLQSVTRGIDLKNDTHAANRALEDVLQTLAKSPRLRLDRPSAANLKEDQILNRLAHHVGVSEDVVRRRLGELRRTTAGRYKNRTNEEDASSVEVWKIDPRERELMEIVVSDPDSLGEARLNVQANQLVSVPCRIIYECCCRLDDAGERVNFDRLLLETDDPRLKSFLVELDERATAKGADSMAKRRHEVLDFFRRKAVMTAARAHTLTLQEGRCDESEKIAILQQIIEQERSRHGISGPTDG